MRITMKKIVTTIIPLVLITLLALPGWAQQRAGKVMAKRAYDRDYNLNTVETIEGEVVDITYNPSKKNSTMMGVHMLVKTSTETVPVHLGPTWYMEQQESIKKGDKLAITGSRITFNGAPALVAAIVIRNQMTLHLRDRNGYPAWRGWRRGNRLNR